jgi:hypothetical protein
MLFDPLTARLAAFVESVGIPVRAVSLDGNTFLPGLDIAGGALLIDEARLAHPGDILHEAGHLAVADPARRQADRLVPTDAEEMAAQAWSFAALKAIGLDPACVFHGAGYQGGGSNLADAFADGRGPGVPYLAWLGMTVDPIRAEQGGPPPYPAMLAWLRSG